MVAEHTDRYGATAVESVWEFLALPSVEEAQRRQSTFIDHIREQRATSDNISIQRF